MLTRAFNQTVARRFAQGMPACEGLAVSGGWHLPAKRSGSLQIDRNYPRRAPS